MGGNAIKRNGVSLCKRLNKQHYERVKQTVMEKLAPTVQCEVVIELPDKQDFGDLDVLYLPQSDFDVTKLIEEVFGVSDDLIVREGHITSFALDCHFAGLDDSYFQIDMIKCASKQSLEMVRFFLSYGDLGSILGHVFSHNGLKFGHDGLWCQVKENLAVTSSTSETHIGKMLLSASPADICQFAGLDYNVWKEQFPLIQTENAIFDWIMSSRFFNPAYFLGKGNCEHRRRQSKRPCYERFVQCAHARAQSTLQNENSNQSTQSSDDVFHQAVLFFEKEKELTELLANFRLDQERTKKFTGLDVLAAFENLHGSQPQNQEIGPLKEAIRHFCLAQWCFSSLKMDSQESVHLDAEWERFLDSHTRAEVLEFINEFVRAHPPLPKSM